MFNLHTYGSVLILGVLFHSPLSECLMKGPFMGSFKGPGAKTIGPPPFVQQIIASKSAAAASPPDDAKLPDDITAGTGPFGPPAWVQGLMNAKGSVDDPSYNSEGAIPIPMGPPAWVEGIITSKAANFPIPPGAVKSSPPSWVQGIVSAKMLPIPAATSASAQGEDEPPVPESQYAASSSPAVPPYALPYIPYWKV